MGFAARSIHILAIDTYKRSVLDHFRIIAIAAGVASLAALQSYDEPIALYFPHTVTKCTNAIINIEHLM